MRPPMDAMTAWMTGESACKAPLGVLSQILLRRSCPGSGPCLWRGLGSQGVEKFGRSAVFVSGLAYHLSFLDHVHEFHTS